MDVVALDGPSGELEGDAEQPVTRRWIGRVQVAAAVIPILVAVVVVAGKRWAPVSDLATELMRTSDVGGSHTPLVGAYSRFVFNHPGPAMYYLFAPFTRVFGPTGMLVATGLANAACMAGIVIVVRRRVGDLGGTLAVLVIFAMCRSMGTGLWVEPWNPWLPLFPFLFASVCAWSVSDRDVWCLPWLIAASSFAVQCHIGYLPLVGVLALATIVMTLVAHRHDVRGSLRRSRKPLIISGVVAVVMWLPAIVQQLTGSPGNLVLIWDYLFSTKHGLVGWTYGSKLMAAELSPMGSWLTGRDNVSGYPPTTSVVWLFAILGAVAVLGGLAWRAGHKSIARLSVFALVVDAGAVMTAAQIQGVVSRYLIRWSWSVAAVTWMSIVLSIFAVVGSTVVSGTKARIRADRSRPSPFALAGVGAVVLLSCALIPEAWRTPAPAEGRGGSVLDMANLVAPRLNRSDKYLLEWNDSELLEGMNAGFASALERKGINVYWPYRPINVISLGTARQLASPSDADGVLIGWSIEGDVNAFKPPPDARVIARYDPRTRANRRAREALAKQLPDLTRDAYFAPPGTSEAKRTRAALIKAQAEIAKLDARGLGYVIALMPPPR